MLNFFRLCLKDEISFDIVAKNGNNVEATFDFVDRIALLVAFDNVASTLYLLLLWTALLFMVCFQLLITKVADMDASLTHAQVDDIVGKVR